MIAFISKDPEAISCPENPNSVGRQSLREGFSLPITADLEKRALSCQLPKQNGTRTPVFISAFHGGHCTTPMEFETRLQLLRDLKQLSFREYLPFWHDEASLLCQIDNLAGGAARFRELRAFRKIEGPLWFWVNERALLVKNGSGRLREMSFVVKDAQNGWAEFLNTNTRIKFQPYQFPGMKAGQAFLGYVQFTLEGMQVVPKRFAEADLFAMGLK